MKRGRVFSRREAVSKVPPEADCALVSIYRRPDAYYVVCSARTTTGLWLGRAERPVVMGVDASAESLGQTVLDLLSQQAEIVRHPRQDEWTEQARAFRAPLVSQAGVRSWRAFLAPAELVDVSRQASAITVVPMRRDRRRPDVFSAVDTAMTELVAPSSGDLGRAIIAAFDPDEPAVLPGS